MTRKPPALLTRFGARRVRAVAAAGVLAAASVGGIAVTAVNAQQSTPSPATSPRPSPAPGTAPSSADRTQMQTEYINRLAQNLGLTPDRVRAGLTQTAIQTVDAAVAAGRLTAEQAQEAKTRIAAGEFGGIGFGGRGGPGRGGPGGGGFGASSEQLAQFLGITVDQLRTERNGQSLVQVAQAHGRTRDQLIQFLTTTAQQRIAADVQAGRLTQAQATERLANLSTRITQIVDDVRQQGQRSTPSGSPLPNASPRP